MIINKRQLQNKSDGETCQFVIDTFRQVDRFIIISTYKIQRLEQFQVKKKKKSIQTIKFE